MISHFRDFCDIDNEDIVKRILIRRFKDGKLHMEDVCDKCIKRIKGNPYWEIINDKDANIILLLK